ncbi:MAG: AGE family epimerase/isomerase [Bryobacterales bacterium]|nr:AGE family epimerase/isomerase [Bryobacterales bacterium]
MPELDGLSADALRRQYHYELFDLVLPFWERHGIDHERGGVMCSLDYDGTRVNDEKRLWFQGRGLWVYSYLYNHFGQQTRHLDIARKIKDFMLRHAPQSDGWWAEVLDGAGGVLRPFSGDLYGMYFAAEGLQEYAWAAKDDEARDTAFSLLKKLFDHIHSKDFRDPSMPGAGIRPQGLWMVTIQNGTQILPRWDDPDIRRHTDAALEAITEKHYNRDTGLNTEILRVDFTPPEGEANKCLVGHAIECLWMALDEALRRKDETLARTCATRMRHHLDVGWDHVYGGLVDGVNVDQTVYEWPEETLVGTNITTRARGEYNYRKTYWAVNEVLVAAMKAFELTRADWAARYFALAQRVADEKFSQARRNLGSHMIASDRRMTFQERSVRQDNYHPLRRLLYVRQALDRIAPEA